MGIVLAALAAVLGIVFTYHRICLSREKALLQPLGTLVQVDGHNMSIYTEGSGEKTLVFLAGGGTCSPILDFRSLYSLLRDEYRIAVVEKFGYGFSDIADVERSIGTILNETRAGLAAAGIPGPYVLCPHSMSGIEALYWAQEYPEEVEAIIGLDMAVPPHYAQMNISLPLMRATQFAMNAGIARLLPGISESDAILHGTLTEQEKAIYRAVFFSRTACAPMLAEAAAIRENADIVQNGAVPQTPMLLFLSDGSGGTGFDTESWRQIPRDYLAANPNAVFIALDCPHYVHDYEYERISREIRAFLSPGA